MVDELRERQDESLLRPIAHTSRAFYVLIIILGGIVAWASYAYYVQLSQGLIVTGMRNTVSWGVYISNFVFFIGISHVGALMSAILRLTEANWRKPITRMAEAITVCSLFVGASMPIIDLGRPERFLNIVAYGRIQSAILWDFLSISTYLGGSLLFLYLFMIPDIAICRDRLKGVGRWKKWLYNKLSAHWIGTQRQREHLNLGISIMTILIIPIAISVHTVVSWIFAMTLRVGWNSTIFGPYFVAGALFSGVASVLMAMAIFARVYHLENYITAEHFRNLGLILLVLDIIYIYFTINEYLTVAYKMPTEEAKLLGSLSGGDFSTIFWTVQIGGLVIPAFLLAIPRTRTTWGIVISATLVNVAMWLKRYVIVVSSLAVPMLPYNWGQYQPTWIEWSITAGGFAAFVLMYAVFSKLFPIVSIWELQEGAPAGAPVPNHVEVGAYK